MENGVQNTEEIWRLVDAKKDAYTDLSDRIWDMPELLYAETKSCAEHVKMLEAEGFRVTRDLAGILAGALAGTRIVP